MGEGKKIYRIEQGAKLAGVCGGIAEYFNIDPTLARLAFIILFFFASVGLWIYIAAALIMPKKSDVYPGC